MDARASGRRTYTHSSARFAKGEIALLAGDGNGVLRLIFVYRRKYDAWTKSKHYELYLLRKPFQGKNRWLEPKLGHFET